MNLRKKVLWIWPQSPNLIQQTQLISKHFCNFDVIQLSFQAGTKKLRIALERKLPGQTPKPNLKKALHFGTKVSFNLSKFFIFRIYISLCLDIYNFDFSGRKT